MRYSETPTDYIAVRVNSNSDFDCIDFGIVQLTEAYKALLIERQLIAANFIEDPTFNHLDFNDDNIKFYNWEEMTDDLDEIQVILEDAESCYVTIDDDFDSVQHFTIPEQTLGALSLRMGSHGAFNYVCYDDNNGDEYYTGGIIL